LRWSATDCVADGFGLFAGGFVILAVFVAVGPREQRPGDAAQKAILEWVDEVITAAPAPEAKEGEAKTEEKK